MKNTSIQHSGGFTLVETLVAITVLLVAIGGPLTLANNSLVDSRIAKERLTATFLAQEGVEYVRYVRGNNFLKGNNWMANLGSCSGQNGCTIDVPSGVISSCGSGCDVMTYNTTSYQYAYATGGDWITSPYTRRISVVSAGDEAVVKVQVSWQDGTKVHTVTTEEGLQRWYGEN